MTFISFFAPALFAAFVGYLLAPLAGRLALRLGAVDQPGPRKVHLRPIPRLGGLAVVAAVAVAAVATFAWLPEEVFRSVRHLLFAVGLGVLPVVAVSILDDIKTLGPAPKFAAHAAGAILAVSLGVSLGSDVHLFGYTITIGVLAFPLSVLWIVGVTNAFNIVDGLDGLSAGLALISAMSLAWAFVIAGQLGMASAVLVLAGALAGFLPHNLYPARMFLGDTGATAVGFCLAAFALKGGSTLSAGFATLLPVLVLGLPIAETLISMARRLMKRLEQRGAGGVFEADRNHMHHRLLALGVEHPRAVWILYGAGVCLAAGALTSMFMTARDAALLLVSLLLAGFLGVRRLGYDEFAIIRNGVVLRAYDAPVLNRSMFAVFVDLTIVATAVSVAVMLKTDDWNLAGHRNWVVGMTAVLAPITIVTFSRMGLYRGTWRLAGIEEFVRACAAVFVATLLGLIARMLLAPEQSSLSLFAIYGLVAIVLVNGCRASYQVLTAFQRRAHKRGTPAIIYGAGAGGASALRELLANFAATFDPVAFVDDDSAKTGRLVNGLPVVGSFQTLEGTLHRLGAQAIVVSSDAISPTRLAELGELCERLDVALLKMQVSFDRLVTAALGEAADRARDLIQPAMATVGAAAPSLAAATTTPPGRPIIADPRVDVRFEAACVPGTRVPIVSGHRCPACRSYRMQRSRVRSVTERVRKHLTPKRPFRCDHCGWRGWRHVVEATISLPFPPLAPPTRLDRIDAFLQKTPSDGPAADVVPLNGPTKGRKTSPARRRAGGRRRRAELS
jgi:UDP-GlcNAc:undecaprenyl-phosphate GlcNAc-1-phosphate transferase